MLVERPVNFDTNGVSKNYSVNICCVEIPTSGIVFCFIREKYQAEVKSLQIMKKYDSRFFSLQYSIIYSQKIEYSTQLT